MNEDIDAFKIEILRMQLYILKMIKEMENELKW